MTDIFWAALAGTMTGGLLASIGFGLMVFFSVRGGCGEDEVEFYDFVRDADGKPIAARKIRIPLLKGASDAGP